MRKGQGRYRDTHIVTFAPRYLLDNRSTHKLAFAQREFARGKVRKPPNSRHVLWLESPAGKRSLCVPGRGQSGRLHLHAAGLQRRLPLAPQRLRPAAVRAAHGHAQLHLVGGLRGQQAQVLPRQHEVSCTRRRRLVVCSLTRARWFCRDTLGNCFFLRTEISLKGATYQISFSDTDQLSPPFRVHNISEVNGLTGLDALDRSGRLFTRRARRSRGFLVLRRDEGELRVEPSDTQSCSDPRCRSSSGSTAWPTCGCTPR